MKARMMMMVVLAALLLAASQVWAQGDGSFTVGGGFWNQSAPEAKFREYRDLPRGAFLSDYVLRQFDGKWAGAAWGSSASRYDQTNSMYIAKGVTWRLDAAFSGTPHLFSQVAHSPYAQNQVGVFTLPDSLQRQIQNLTQTLANPSQNKTLQDLLRSAPGVALGLQTDVTKVRLRGRPMKDWQFEVKGTDRVRSGSQALGATLGGPGGPAVELPAPIDQRMVDVDATGSYVHGPAKVMATLGMSSFKNNINTIKFDNFKVFNTTYSSRSAVNAMSTAPDNDVVRGRVVGSWQLPYASVFTATIGVSQTTQKKAFVPMTVNDTILVRSRVGTDSLALERGNLDGKVTDIVQDYRLTGRPIANFYGTLRFRQEKMDDKTPALGMPYGFVNYDQAWSRGAAETEGASNTKTVFGFDGDYSLSKQVDVSVLAERRTRELPDWREVTKDAENVFGAKLHLRPMDGTEASFGYQMGQRRMDSFIEDAYDGAEWPSFRRYDVADRDQTKFDGAINWSALASVELSVNGWYSKDKYPNSGYGLQSVDNTQFFGEGTWHATKLVDLSGGFGYGEQKGSQSSIENPNAGVSDTMSVAPWTADLKDKSVYAFARMDWWAKPKKLQLTADYTFTRDMLTFDFAHVIQKSAAGIIPANVASTTAINLQPSFNRMHDIAVTGTWHYTAQMDVACTYGYTKYDIADPLYQGISYVNVIPNNGATAASGIFLGNNKLNFNAQRFQVRATRRF
jgi:MtrB/PioB family decaheme-associated outer membrane protein